MWQIIFVAGRQVLTSARGGAGHVLEEGDERAVTYKPQVEGAVANVPPGRALAAIADSSCRFHAGKFTRWFGRWRRSVVPGLEATVATARALRAASVASTARQMSITPIPI